MILRMGMPFSHVGLRMMASPPSLSCGSFVARVFPVEHVAQALVTWHRNSAFRDLDMRPTIAPDQDAAGLECPPCLNVPRQDIDDVPFDDNQCGVSEAQDQIRPPPRRPGRSWLSRGPRP